MTTKSSSRYKTIILAVLALLALGLIASPQARAELASFFGLPVVNVLPSDSTVTITDASGATLSYKLTTNVSFNREPQIGEMTYLDTTTLIEARSFLGVEGPLPVAIEGTAMLAYTETDKNGQLIMAGLSQPNEGFWARYRPGGDHQTQINYSSDWQVNTEQVTIGGFPGLQITAKGIKGNTTVELWLLNGDWVYELRCDRGDLARLVKIVESMK